MINIKKKITDVFINYMIKHHPDMIAINKFTIVCDKCGWNDGERHDYNEDYVKTLVDYKCPKCGAVCITQDDVDMMMKLNGKIGNMKDNPDKLENDKKQYREQHPNAEFKDFRIKINSRNLDNKDDE